MTRAGRVRILFVASLVATVEALCRSGVINKIADAPSLRPEALPAVTVPFFRNAGLSLAKPSNVVSGRGCSSVATSNGSPLRCGICTGITSLANKPFSQAAWLRL